MYCTLMTDNVIKLIVQSARIPTHTVANTARQNADTPSWQLCVAIFVLLPACSISSRKCLEVA